MLCNDPFLLVLLPQGEFRNTIRTTTCIIPAFHYIYMVQRWIYLFLMELMWGGIMTSSLLYLYLSSAALKAVCELD